MNDKLRPPDSGTYLAPVNAGHRRTLLGVALRPLATRRSVRRLQAVAP